MVAIDMNTPLDTATELASPISMPSIPASSTTARMSPTGIGSSFAPLSAVSAALVSLCIGLGAQRRKVALSACAWTCRSVAATTRSCLSIWPSWLPSILRRLATSSMSSATWILRRSVLCRSSFSAPRQRRRAESTRKSMPCTSSSTASRSTSSDSTSCASAAACAERRASHMRSFVHDSWSTPPSSHTEARPSGSCTALLSVVTCRCWRASTASSGAVRLCFGSSNSSSSPSRSKALTLYMSTRAAVKPTTAARRFHQLRMGLGGGT
mmetsp:Transcript_66810/g.196103  ORF Transcript_66810/g.196103 Transcript_66810/m.196103 type:complete len:268 (+) Transcript_66810:548-1351(+)